MIYLVIYITDNCTACSRVVNSAKKVSKFLPNVKLQIKNINEPENKMNIVPAVFIDQDLFCYGEFNKDKLMEHLSEKK